ncbi:polysaccharide deacetylase family protein [uncultured Bacteroides sp.]|uniref:polysaccharide deacetylase family protein n=1 Tax=uncultured Bacteroides sp. TaxID=162156 RepID=UPI002AA825DA|nr:polysaccharide deacetylase family protein [uncultured Bacteroides sp.]
MDKQIFQTENTLRWKKFKWSMRFIFFIAAILIAALIIMLFIDKSPSLPFRQDYRSVVTASKPFMQETKLSKEYKGFREYISDKKWHTNYEKENEASLKRYRKFQSNKNEPNVVKSIETWNKFPAGIRSAFYVAWDPQSYFSLKRNIRNLNLIMPEWFFIDPKTDELKTNVDPQGFNLMKKSGVPIMPMLSNNFDREFRPEAIGRILHSEKKRKKMIFQVLAQCLRNKFVGINIDFEDLNESNNEYLIQFVKEISTAFHSKGLLVTQDIMPFNDDYNIKELAKYNDYLFLMAYDEYSSGGDPGPISSQKWIEATVDDLAKKAPAGKIILGLGAFGYDWSVPAITNQNLTYQQALSKASASNSKINFDNNTYNLNYAYKDDKNIVHQVYFTDAATHFNTMRFGAEYGLAGFGLWRLGSEDSRVWKFYNKNLEKNAVSKISKRDLEDVKMVNDVDYIGDGEVLDVLNTPHPGKIRTEIDSTEMLISEENYIKIPSTYQIRKYGEAGPKQLLLTFDDGPDETYTPQILDILSKYHVPAAFFVVGLQAEKNLPLIKRIYDEGNLIGNHTFTHRNVANNTPERTFIELKLTRLLIECITGHSTILFRAPYNADSEPASMEEIVPVAWAREQNYLDVGETIDPEDWQVGIKANTIFIRVVKAVEQGRGHIILLHDAGGDTRAETVKALPMIIEYFHKKGYTFTTISSILDKDKQELMPEVPKGNGYYVMQANLALASITYWATNFLTSLFIIFIIMGIARLTFMMILTIRERHKNRSIIYDEKLLENAPLVSIIVPAYNEEVNAVSSLNNLLKQNYPNFNIIFIDDGSKDETYKRVCDALSTNEKIRIFTKPNGGKASALNFGIGQTDAEYVVCIDADTKLYPNAVSLMMLHFLDKKNERNVGSVAGNVKVGNQINLLTKWQAIEYITSQNFDRLAFANINAITVVPGAIGAFKKAAIDEAGGFTTDTLAEDCDLTIRILKAGYTIENENKAIAMTEAPEKTKQFIKQRTRWSFGVMQTFWKHRDTLLDKKFKGLGIWAMPNILIFQFIIPFFSPLADLFMLFGIFTGNAERIGFYYLIFMLVDISISVVAFIFEGEKVTKLIWIIPQRFCYRWIMYVVLFKSFRKAIKGELQTWGVLKRSGNVADLDEDL